jgi:hypothetical protein
MGKYTIHGGEIDKIIEKQLQTIVSEIISNLPGIASILLIGGFGRGEGSIKRVNNLIYPLKDFDFLLIFDKKVPFELVKIVQIALRQKLSNQNSLDPYPYRSFTVDLDATTLENLNLLPDIMVYEAKVASQVLYGEDIRHKIMISKEDIPLRSGARILFQKGISLIGQFSTKYLYEQIPEGKIEMFVYECAKVFVELGTSLSILGGLYEPSYARRASLLSKWYKKLFPDLYEKIPDLGQKIAYYTEFKLNPDIIKIREDPISLWFTAREYLIETLKYYMAKYLNVDQLDDYHKFCYQLREYLKREYYRPLIAHNLYIKLKIPPTNAILSLLNLTFQLYGNFCYIRNVTRDNKYRVSLQTIDFCCPTLNFFYATLLMLRSINENGSIDVKNLNTVNKVLKLKPKHSFCSSNSTWENTRQLYLDSLSYLPYIY